VVRVTRFTPPPAPHQESLPIREALLATRSSTGVATAPPPVAALVQNFTSDPMMAGSSRSSPMVRHSCYFSSLSPSLDL
jgi:hypothetical protein